MYEFWYKYIKPKYNEQVKIYVYSDGFIAHVKTKAI